PEPAPIESHLQRFIPKELQARLDAARASGEMVGERRVVTMLFSDVKGSTAAAEQLDPEDWSEIINAGFEFMIKPIYRYEGIVARLMGDGILGFFGAPIAHEDDPQRAILAGLEIVAGISPYREQVRQRYGVDFDVRVGINTGLVVVGAVGSDLRMEYTALGDAINLAARMEQTARPGTVQVAHDTYKLVKPLFEFEELGGIEVKGKAEPVPAYRALGAKELAGRGRGIEGLHAEMVGRRVELATLRELMVDLKQGVGRIVCLMGDAGVGKTRLIQESRKVFLQVMGGEANWHETTTLSYETNQAYGLLQRLLRRVEGIAYDDPLPHIRQTLASVVEGLAQDRRPGAMQVLEALFGLNAHERALPLEGEAFRRELFEAVQGWWRTRFGDRPTVLVFDDMHWGDTASIELLLQLLPLTEEIPVVLLCAMRGEREAPSWQIKTQSYEHYPHRYTEMSLRPLTEEESDELVSRLLAIAEISDPLRARILERSAGNPFFIEEVVRTLIENGAVYPEERAVNGELRRYWRSTSEAADFAIPDNLRSLLAARMDRLEEATRATLQMASVIGRNFYYRVLQAVDEGTSDLDKNVGTLLRLDMIREMARVPEVEYSFRNPLTQEAVYKTILLKRRREFHRRVGEAMVELYPDRLEGLYGLLAHHFALAGEREKAIEYSRRAAKQALAVYAYDDAAQNLRAALELIPPGEVSAIHLSLREECADIFCLLRDGARAIAEYQQALELWRGLQDSDRMAGVRLHRKIVQAVTDLKWSVSLENLQRANTAREDSRASLVQALDQLEREPPYLETVRARIALSADAWRIQEPPDWDAAQRFAQAAVDMAATLDSPVDLSQAHGALANVLDGRSRLREHLQMSEQRLAICRQPEFSDLRETLEALRGLGTALMYVGEYAQALPYLAEAEGLATQVQAIDQIANVLTVQAQCLFRTDRWDEVLALEEKWRDLERRHTRERVGATCFLVALSASVHALRGDTDRANTYAQESYDFMVSISGKPEQWQRNQFY
ncbi:MAG TPA: adenylate/guanylate cyclase domain-containing protein, partial [Anaerolineales bacterium]|nr:adenylate/guanylate cyclase domain-containing protein [Anaerolineales bacterium]